LVDDSGEKIRMPLALNNAVIVAVSFSIFILDLIFSTSLKTCPFCANANQHDESTCAHCGIRLRGDFGFLTYVQMTGILVLALAGLYFWPLLVVALIAATTIKVRI
jgi:hypothetical protein